MVNFSHLPSELLVHTLSYLDCRDVVRCQAISRRFCEITHSLILRYAIELSVAGFTDNAAHQGLDLSLPLSRGLFMFTYETPEPTNPISPAVSFNHLAVVQVSRAEEGVPTWTLDFEESFHDFCVDPIQDLLILWRKVLPNSNGYKLSLLSLRHGTPLHVSSVFLAVDPSVPSDYTSIDVKVSGDFIVACIYRTRGLIGSMDITFIRWRTGEIEVRLHRDRQGSLRFASFCLLSNDLFAIGVTPPSTLESLALEVYSFREALLDSQCGEPPGTPTHIATYELPPLQDRVHPLHLGMMSTAGTDLYDPASHPRSFVSVGSSSLLAISMILMRSPASSLSHLMRILLVIPVCSLTPMLSNAAQTSPRASKPLTIPWDSWGPSCSRCFHLESEQPRFYGKSMYAYRMLLPHRLLDFNPIDLARELCRTGSSTRSGNTIDLDGSEIRGEDGGKDARSSRVPHNTSMIITEETRIPAGDMFIDDVVTRLPYRSTPLDIPARYGTILGGEDWIGMETDHRDRIKALHIFSFGRTADAEDSGIPEKANERQL
ncbi:hypothetical protein A0H81_12696 [Grifola frondosa]|uniref:F-box domain-containing protein n=1 Tax=Grifola frondosa TaxID=5627 RepID=A0A1C7LR76_GRIFR|nr:hypothetical protein A0H81_12696 [Grifola frondosa]